MIAFRFKAAQAKFHHSAFIHAHKDNLKALRGPLNWDLRGPQKDALQALHRAMRDDNTCTRFLCVCPQASGRPS